MPESLFHYERVHPTTWVYLSSLLIIGLYFKFGRIWSVRNVDLLLLILLAPGLLLVHFGEQQQKESLRIAQQSPSGQPEVGRPHAVVPGIDFAGRMESFLTSQLSEDSAASSQRPTDNNRLVPETETTAPPDRRVVAGQRTEWFGYLWLFCIGGIWLGRLLLDPTMVRRPLLEPNLAIGGMAFLGLSLFVLLAANVVVSQPAPEDLAGPQSAAQLLSRSPIQAREEHSEEFGPGLSLVFMLPSIPTMTLSDEPDAETSAQSRRTSHVVMAKTMAIVSHLAIVVGMVLIGYRHFDNSRMGVGAAALYLLLPYTAQMAGRVNHVLPAALLVWAVLSYRRPLVAGIFLGLATGIVYYPLFLLPLWISFYWQRGLARFVAGVVSMLSLVAFSLLFVSSDAASYWSHVQRMFGLIQPAMSNLQGVWAVWDPVFRLPVLAAFVALSASLALWPPQKNLGTLLSCSAAVMVAAQFWHGFGGGIYMAWYLPLALLTVFRPNLEDRVALTVLGEAKFPRRRWRGLAVEGRAA